jgi:hypothetical protein
MRRIEFDYGIHDGKVIVPTMANEVIDRFAPR